MPDVLKILGDVSIGCIRLAWGMLCAFVDIWKYGRELFGERKGLNTHGDADWARDKQLKKKGAFDPRGFLILFTESGKRVFGRKNRGAIILAGPGQGKSQNVLANFQAKALVEADKRQHLIVYDLAGELYRRGRPILEPLGYKCEIIDFQNPGNGVTYDIQSYLNPDSRHFKSDLKAFSKLLVAPEPMARQPHFVDYARLMLEDVVTLNLKFEGGKKTIPECVDELMSRPQRNALLKRMGNYSHDFNAMDIFNRMNGEEGIAMESTSLRKLDDWTLEAIRDVSVIAKPTPERPRGWTFEDMFNDTRPCALFIRTGLSPGGGEFARAVFGNAINTIRRLWDATEMEHPRGFQAFIDEAARLGTCTALLDGHNELRKAGYSQWLGFLSYAAMENLYGKEAKTLFNGCDHIILPGNQDMEVNETYSRMIGDMTIESGSRNESNYGGESTGKNEQARRRIKADELRRADEELSFGVVGNLNVRGLATFKMKKGVPILR